MIERFGLRHCCGGQLLHRAAHLVDAGDDILQYGARAADEADPLFHLRAALGNQILDALCGIG